MRTIAVIFFAVVAVAILIAGAFSAFIVNQYQQAIVLQFGEPVAIYSEPGLHWRIPFVQTVEFFDKRIISLDSDEQEVTASDQKRLAVNAFARYRIIDPLQFYKSFRTEDNARRRLTSILDSTLRNVLASVTLIDIVRNRRDDLMKKTAEIVSAEVKKLGVDLVDVRITRADLPEANSQAVIDRMKSERQQEAQDLRSQGNAEAERIRSTADREVTVIKAEANRDAQRIRGEGDAQRNKIYADAYGRDPEFFAFYRSMLAYEQAMTGSNTKIVVTPGSSFFEYFNSPGAQQGAGGATKGTAR